jgi:hypothetical protein
VSTPNEQRAKALRYILCILRDPLLPSSPIRKRAIELAHEHNLTVEELLEAARGSSREA